MGAEAAPARAAPSPAESTPAPKKPRVEKDGTVELDLKSLLSATSAKEKHLRSNADELRFLLEEQTVREASVSQKFQNKDASLKLMAFCAEGSREDCIRVNGDKTCDKIHFRKIIKRGRTCRLGTARTWTSAAPWPRAARCTTSWT